jgi:glycosyltransferase involved in cell wall biosynthesis
LLGVLCSRLFHVPCKGIYHTDFTLYTQNVLHDETVAGFVREYIRWFYNQCEQIRVPTLEYISMLEQRGYHSSKMVRFRRGIDKNIFKPKPRTIDYLQDKVGVQPGFTLLYAGRVSKEKNMDFLFTLYKDLLHHSRDINLIVCGDGPDYTRYRQSMADYPRVHFTGRLSRNQLPDLYSHADLFVFPSNTDTFGMVVLEAQACGLPALVSDRGGPHEIVIDTKTGYVGAANSVQHWRDFILRHQQMLQTHPEKHLEMRHFTREHIVHTYSWDNVLNDLFGMHVQLHKKHPAAVQQGEGRVPA